MALASGCLLASAKRAGEGEIVRIDVRRVGEHGARQGQRAGLVEHDPVGLGQTLERLAGIEDQAVAEERAGRDDLNRRNSEAERAGTGDDQDGDGDDERLLPSGPEQEPDEEGRERCEMHDRHIELRRAVGEPDIGRALVDGLLEQAVDLVDERAFGSVRHADF